MSAYEAGSLVLAREANDVANRSAIAAQRQADYGRFQLVLATFGVVFAAGAAWAAIAAAMYAKRAADHGGAAAGTAAEALADARRDAAAQAEKFEAQLKVAQASADAATKAAEHIQIVERAYPYPLIEHPGAFGELMKEAEVFFLEATNKDHEPAPLSAELLYSIKNFGKTPAIIRGVYVAIGPEPLTTLPGVGLRDRILGANEPTGVLTIQFNSGLSRDQVQEIRKRQLAFLFQGTIDFEDVWRQRYGTNFTFGWQPEEERWELSGVHTVRIREEGLNTVVGAPGEM